VTAVGDCPGGSYLDLIDINVLVLILVGANVIGYDDVVHDFAPIRNYGSAGAVQAEFLSS
jgi:hypothetical protein